MKLEHFGMAEPGDCRLVFTASAEELTAALAKEQAAPDAPQDEEELLTAAVNRTILEGFDPLYRQLVQEQQLVPVTDPDFELLAVNKAEGFRAGAQFYALPPLELGRDTGFVQAIEPHPLRRLTIELEINRNYGDEERAAEQRDQRIRGREVAADVAQPGTFDDIEHTHAKLAGELAQLRLALGRVVPARRALRAHRLQLLQPIPSFECTSGCLSASKVVVRRRLGAVLAHQHRIGHGGGVDLDQIVNQKHGNRFQHIDRLIGIFRQKHRHDRHMPRMFCVIFISSVTG